MSNCEGSSSVCIRARGRQGSDPPSGGNNAGHVDFCFFFFLHALAWSRWKLKLKLNYYGLKQNLLVTLCRVCWRHEGNCGQHF